MISIGIGYSGFKKVTNNTTKFEIVGLEISAHNKTEKQQGYIYLGLATIIFLGGIYTFSKFKN